MPLGNPIRKQNESRVVSVLATEGQTVFTVQGGYIINHISVFRNGVRLSNAEDFTAGDGSTVTLNNAANIEDRIEFHVFDRFTVQNAIVGAASTQTINGDLVLNGKLFGQLDVPSINLTGIVTATELDLNGKGDISGDLNVVGVSTFVDVNTRNITGVAATFTGDVSIPDTIVHTGDTNTKIRFPAADTVSIETAGSERVRITSGGNVHLNSGNTTSSSLMILDKDGSGEAQIRFYNAAANTAQIALDSSEELTFDVNSAERLRITSTGTVLKGITTARANYANNTSGVEYGFQIEDTNATKSSLSLIRSSNDANDGGIFIGKTRSTSVGGNTVVQAGDDLGTITFGGADGTSLQFGATITAEVQSGVGNDDMPTDLVFTTNGGSTNTVERLRITSGGIVQIGGAPENSADIDTSNTKLIIKQSGGAQEDGIYMERSGERRGHYIYIGGALDQNDALCVTTNQLGGDTDLLAIDRAGDVIIGAGNLGIHSTSPDRRFTLYQNATTRMNLKSLADSTVGIEFGDPADHNVGFIVYDNTDDSMQFGVNAGERLRISSGGQVRMNTGGAPAADLHVGGTDAALNAYFQTSRSSGAYHHYAIGNSGASLGYIGSAGQISGSGGATGFAFRSEDHIQFCSGGNTERVRIDSSGRLLIAATSGTARVHIKGSGGDGIKIENSGGTNAACIDLKNTLSSYVKEYRIAVAGSDGAYGSASSLFVRDQTAGATRLELATSGDLKVNTGDIFFGTAGKGICLGNTANVDANTLDDYEEGSWTPTLLSGGSSTTYNASNQLGSYTKIGRLVRVTFYLSWPSIAGSPTGYFDMGGLPFTAGNSGVTNLHITTGSAMYNSMSIAQGNQIIPYIADQASTLSFYTSATGQAWTRQSINSSFHDGGQIIGGITYII